MALGVKAFAAVSLVLSSQLMMGASPNTVRDPCHSC